MPEVVYTPITIENYNELLAAVMQGAQSVSYSHPGGSKSVTYRSLDEMFRLLRFLERRLGLAAAGGGRTYAAFSKGYGRPACGAREEGGECHDRFNVDTRCCP